MRILGQRIEYDVLGATDQKSSEKMRPSGEQHDVLLPVEKPAATTTDLTITAVLTDIHRVRLGTNQYKDDQDICIEYLTIRLKLSN